MHTDTYFLTSTALIPKYNIKHILNIGGGKKTSKNLLSLFIFSEMAQDVFPNEE